jgi:hypothetical protein
MLRAKSRGYRRWVGVFAAALSVLACAHPVPAGPVPGYIGHTSPHSRDLPSENFSRPDKDGNIRPVSLIAAEKPNMPTLLSGTVYYMVYERDDRDPNDPWGTGIPNFLKTFRSGIDFNGGSSPDIDVTAKYLYLYQVINHQRTLPPIESMSTKLLVELSEITSWGHFHGLGFATKGDDLVTRPLSATHKVDPRTYLSPAPALPLTQTLSLAIVPTSRGEVEPMIDAKKGKIVQVHWDALDPATPPDYVMILGSSDFDKHPSFRAIWTGKNAIGKDGRSTAFGFTSPMPPTIEPVRLRTSRDAAKEAALAEAKDDNKTTPVKNVNKADEAVKLAQLAESDATPAGQTIAGVEGRVPTPFPTSAGLAFDPNRDAKSSRDSGAGLPFSGVPFAGAPPATSSVGNNSGFLPNRNTSPPSTGSGIGGGISRGGGTQFVQGATTTVFRGSGTGTGTGTASVTNVNNINFTISQSNQQSQSQFQFQSQAQSQNQRQNQNQSGGGGKGNVVPEPASLIGLAVGLPVLLMAYRRRRAAAPLENQES